MRRREFLKLWGVAAIAFPWPALAQRDLPLVAVLVPGTADLARQRIDALRKGMQEAGFAEGVTMRSQCGLPMVSSTACRGSPWSWRH
jgi:hypothetical protein